MSYARTRAVELTSRNYRALGAVARQMGARLDAVRGAWAAACQARATELRKELEKVDLPCFQVLPPEPGSRLSPEKPGPETCPAPAGPNGVTIRVDARRLVIEAVPESVPDRKCTGQVPLGCFVSAVVSAPAFFDAVLLARKGNHEVLGQAGSTPMSIASLKELRLCGADGTPESDPSKTLALTPASLEHVLFANEQYVVVSYRVFADKGKRAKSFAIAHAIRAAAENQCDLINMSLGLVDEKGHSITDVDPTIEAALVFAEEHGVLCIVEERAAGSAAIGELRARPDGQKPGGGEGPAYQDAAGVVPGDCAEDRDLRWR